MGFEQELQAMPAEERKQLFQKWDVGFLEGAYYSYRRKFWGAFGALCIAVGIGIPVAEYAAEARRIKRFERHVGRIIALNRHALQTDMFCSGELSDVVEQERLKLGISPIRVVICGQDDECRKQHTSYAQMYSNGERVIYLQPWQLTRGIVRHELWHVKHDLPAMRGKSEQEQAQYYWTVGEPAAAAYGAGKTF
jgi:hypothetical protein